MAAEKTVRKLGGVEEGDIMGGGGGGGGGREGEGARKACVCECGALPCLHSVCYIWHAAELFV